LFGFNFSETERKKLNNLVESGLIMRNFLITMAVLAVFCVSGFAQEVNLNVQSQENAKFQFERYNKMKKVGTGLIIGGAVVGTTGMVIALQHASKADSYSGFYIAGSQEYYDAKEKQDAELAKAMGWLIVEYVGYSAFTAGIPIRIVGRVKANEWKSKLPSAVYVSPNSVKLTWNF
jgi:hypothetical protein